jgi:LysM repeat protein
MLKGFNASQLSSSMISRELENGRCRLKLIPNLVTMKIPTAVKYSIVTALMTYLTSCEDSKTPQGKAQQALTTEEFARGIEFGPWTSKAGLMFAQEQLPPGDYFAEIEGRVSKGENQYRAITKTLNTDKNLSAEAIWGMEAGPLFQHEIDRLRKGMERSKSQVFTDTTGKAIHQLIMVLPAGARTEEPAASTNVASVEDEVVSAIPESILASGTPRTPPSGLLSPKIQPVERISEPDSAVSSSDEIDTLREEASSEETELRPATTLQSSSKPGISEPPNLAPATVEEASAEVGAAIGELETPEPVVEPGSETPEPEDPPRAVIVEDDEIMLETEEEAENLQVDPESTSPAENDKLESAAPEIFLSYKVVRGDTLSGLSRRYKVSIAAIKEASGLKSDALRINQDLKIPTQ